MKNQRDREGRGRGEEGRGIDSIDAYIYFHREHYRQIEEFSLISIHRSFFLFLTHPFTPDSLSSMIFLRFIFRLPVTLDKVRGAIVLH